MKRPTQAGFTLIELLVVVLLIGLLTAIGAPLLADARTSARQAVSAKNLQSLATANLSYAAENGTFCPAQNRRNTVRWHGARIGRTNTFDPTQGFLADYLGESRSVSICPGFLDELSESSFEKSSGGYGYNSAYIGGTGPDFTRPAAAGTIPHPARTLMFATTALARSDGVQEYPYAEPFRAVQSDLSLGGSQQPSVHFRFAGKALVAWCDGHITAETLTSPGSTNYYGGSNEKHNIGFFGERRENGVWNPHR